ncbi:MAG: hypothetical protein R3227_14190, partial [Reinekea sp.]|nr:hypothetical protein [Reinekea sp.]
LLFTSHDQRFIQNIATRFWWIHNGTLTELHDSDVYFHSLAQDTLAAPAALNKKNTDRGTENAGAISDQDEERILERICQLEQWLADDLARKPKFQKPAKQQLWQEELDKLNAVLR